MSLVSPGPKGLARVLHAQSIAQNPVHALALQGELTHEFSKAVWREATANAMQRWLAEGHKPERVASHGEPRRRDVGTYSEEE